MILINCEQGSPEWHQARAGCITASMFSIARTKVGGLDDKQHMYVSAIQSGMTEKEAMAEAGYKAAPKAESVRLALAGKPVGQPSEAAMNYAFGLAVERISGTPLDSGFETWQMKRGHELEPMARMEHELQTGLMVQRAGFVTTDDRAFGASADGLIGDDGGSEYKCFIAPDKLRTFHIDNDASGIMDQVQGCMWITGRKFWHVGMYCPALEPVGRQLWWQEFKRDDDYIEKLEEDLWQFKLLVDGYEAKLRSNAA
ncbi:YqaJ viral recombinase family protein [Pseudomonas sp. RC4D1]|uniref:lambda exonuclease family protein n=1 Tax=Pseudomonas sp. RC4D1 TaxID=2834407 RepID=UPI001BCBDC2E|nr:lambda exonuclease family protein [Pseudomonas sp. RC4D1]MBS7559963.1 YqaJ viral recombinase family protein [Pseudomonas sp. RC4D1]